MSPNQAIEFSAEKPLANGFEQSSGFKVVHVNEASSQKALKVFANKHEEECGMCPLTFNDAKKLFVSAYGVMLLYFVMFFYCLR